MALETAMRSVTKPCRPLLMEPTFPWRYFFSLMPARNGYEKNVRKPISLSFQSRPRSRVQFGQTEGRRGISATESVFQVKVIRGIVVEILELDTNIQVGARPEGCHIGARM